MNIDNILRNRLPELTGRVIAIDEVQLLRSLAPSLPEGIIDILRRYPLVGTTFTLNETDDLSELGVDMKWLTPEGMRSELLEVYPGMSAGVSGYFPIGECLLGTGDPYFVRTDSEDAAVVRIPHDAVDADLRLDESRVEMVTTSLSEFLAKAQFG